MLSVDLNADLAEFDNATNTALLAPISSANICCGVHSGNPLLMHRTLAQARQAGVTVGAHPSYPDRDDFGRKTMMLGAEPRLNVEELHAVIRAQLTTFASLNGGEIAYVKPHGALYNDAQVNLTIAHVVAAEADRYRAAIMGQPGSQMQAAAEQCGLRYVAEVFSDRGYRPDGTLIPRSMPHAVIHDPSEVADRVVRMVIEGTVATWDHDPATDTHTSGVYRFSALDSVCLHGDTEGAYEIAVTVRAALAAAGVAVVSPLAATR